MKHLEKLLWWLLTGKRGGVNRARIIKKLRERPYNPHQLSKELNLDYKTVRHHMDVLIKNNIVRSSGDGQYGTVYMLSNVMKDNFESFKEIWKVSEEEKDI